MHYEVGQSTYGELVPGDMTITDPIWGLVYVVSTEPFDGLAYPAVKLVVEGRSLAFSRVKTEHSDIRYQEWSDIAYSSKACLRLSLQKLEQGAQS